MASGGEKSPPKSSPATSLGGIPVNRTLGVWVQALFWTTGAVVSLTVVFTIEAGSKFDEYWDRRSRSNLEAWGAAEDNASAAFGLPILLNVVLLILLIIWMFRAHRVTDLLGGTDRKWSRGWTIGGWFIPVANFLIPKLVLGEIERIAQAPRTDGRIATDWRKTSASAKGWLWWGLWFLGIVLVRFSGYLPDPSDSDVSYSGAVRTSYLLQALGALTIAAAAAFGAMYIRSIASHLPSPTAMPRSAPTQSQDVGSHSYTGRPTETTHRVEPPASSSPPTTANIAGALRELKALHVEGILTDAEYESKRRALAEQL
jgi:hypothetical protein